MRNYELVLKAIQKKGKTIKEISKELDMSDNTVSKWLNYLLLDGKVEFLSLSGHYPKKLWIVKKAV